MNPRVKRIDPGFSTADGEFPHLEYDDHNQHLHFSFLDWHEQTVLVLFRDVIAVKWQAAEELLADEPYDGSCEILDSPWIGLHRSQEMLDADVEYHHFKFNLNSCGSLEVICTGFQLENQEQSQKTT